jgi:predicted flap endonuclease-1-like 5' DNA nuclease
MSPIAAFVLGLLVGWVIEWIIDWVYWRRRTTDLLARSASTAAENESLKVKIADAEKAALRAKNAAPVPVVAASHEEDWKASERARMDLNGQLTALKAENESLKARLSAAEDAGATARSERDTLQGLTGSAADTLQAKLDASTTENTTLQARIAALEEEKRGWLAGGAAVAGATVAADTGPTGSVAAMLQAKLDAATNENASLQARIAALEDEKRGWLAGKSSATSNDMTTEGSTADAGLVYGVPAPGVLPAADVPTMGTRSTEDILPPEETTPTTAYVPPITVPGSARPAQSADDLIIIRGIGPVIGRKLNEAGIFTFRQLSELTPADLRRIVGDVIQRLADEEDILNQARQLADAKDRRSAL